MEKRALIRQGRVAVVGIQLPKLISVIPPTKQLITEGPFSFLLFLSIFEPPQGLEKERQHFIGKLLKHYELFQP